MRTRTLIIFLILPLALNSQTINISIKDSVCGRELIRNSQNHVLGWYKPDVPGASYDKVAGLASEFIKTISIEPSTGLPMYLVACCFQGPHMHDGDELIASSWMSNPACIFAGLTQSLAVQYRVYSGDDSYVTLVKGMLDYQLSYGTTPGEFSWPKVPYASADPLTKTYQGATRWEDDGMRGDGLHGIEPDKVGELGYAYLRFYEITLDETYLRAAIHCADALANHVRDLHPPQDDAEAKQIVRSPWPFRVNARTGVIIDEYCSNVLEPVKLLDELLRISSRIDISTERMSSYTKAREIAWNWLYAINGPMKTFVWNAYFEDIPNDPDRSNRNQVSPGELAKYLSEHPEMDPDIGINVPSLLYWIANVFKTDGLDAIKEQTWCYEPMGSHTARYGSACAMYYAYSGDMYFKEQAYRFLNVATYMTYDNGVVVVGPTWPGSWFSDGYGDYIRHFLDAMAAIPEWAPAKESHLLKSSSIVQKIAYAENRIDFTTYDSASDVLLRLDSKPKSIAVNGESLALRKVISDNSWTWEPLGKDGVVEINYSIGNQVIITK